jgi:hypothetical protein
MPAKKNTLIKDFRREVQNSLLMDEPSKKSWLSKADTLHPELLKMLVKLVKGSNRQAWKYIKIALVKKPVLLEELREKIKKINRETLALEEKAITPSAEKILEEGLKEI